MREPGLLLVRSADVRRLLPMKDCLRVMEDTFRALADGRALQPVRQVVTLPGSVGALYSMPGFLGDARDGALAVKLVNLFPGNSAAGMETHQGVIVLFNASNGSPVAVIEAASVTAIRTAAVSALATRLLSRTDASVLALLGSGVQAGSHLEAMLLVRSIREVRVWSRTPEHARSFAEVQSQRHGVPVAAVASVEQAVSGAHVVCAVTGTSEPILDGSWIGPGTHTNAVGASTPEARELDSASIARARLFVDSRDAALAEAGDILIPLSEGVIGAEHILAELAELVVGRVSGRLAADDVTVFKSLGLAVEDVAAARAIHTRALADGMRGVDFD